ncbi:hypothetical protein ES702_01988 [subsurface metagenome]
MTEWNRESRRSYTPKESEQAAKKLEETPPETMDFLKGDEAPAEIGSAMPQPPGYPLPARKYGLPSWQTQVQNMVEDAMLTVTGPIGTEQDFENVRNRLKYLLAYQPNLAGDMLTRCDTAIQLLKERVKEYEYSNINQFIKKIAGFVSSPIRTQEQLAEAGGYLSDLTNRRIKLAGEYARAGDLYIARLTERIRDYRERKT